MLRFYKYHGAGNDFILIDERNNQLNLNTKEIAQLCDRHKGIGADGLMLLNHSNKYDFEMKYFNSDGRESTMCGNGGRCIVSFAFDIGIQKAEYQFIAIDGFHQAKILELSRTEKIIELGMIDVNTSSNNKDFIINTGSPHHLNFLNNIKDLNVNAEGKKIRYSNTFNEEGINVDFIEERENELFVRTYERGVENETLACGTGVTAAAIGSTIRQGLKYNEFNIKTLGGELKVKFDIQSSTQFTNVRLIGPATFVFQGDIEI